MSAKKRHWLAVAILVTVFNLPVCLALARSQERTGPIASPPASSQEQLKAKPMSATARQAPLVNLDVLVTDEDGLVLAGLKKDNFRVLDDGKPQTITHFEPVGAPITIVMLMEYRRSAYDYFAYKAAEWGTLFLNHLEAEDYVALVTYDIRPAVRIDFTHNKVDVEHALATPGPPHFTEANLFDAIADTLDRLDRVKGKSAILLIGTGANTMSQSNLDDTLKRIKRSDVTIFSVGVAEAEYISAGASPIGYLQAKNELETFARMSGGMAFFPRMQGEIPGVFRTVATFLRDQYRIGFTPTGVARDGKYHRLKVAIVRPDGSPLVVTNPKGTRRKVVVYAREGYTAPQ
jgi:VWFA-related protein